MYSLLKRTLSTQSVLCIPGFCSHMRKQLWTENFKGNGCLGPEHAETFYCQSFPKQYSIKAFTLHAAL